MHSTKTLLQGLFAADDISFPAVSNPLDLLGSGSRSMMLPLSGIVRQLGISIDRLLQLDDDSDIIWNGKPSADPEGVMSATIERSGDTFFYSAVDTVSPDSHLWVFGDFIVERNDLVLIKETAHCCDQLELRDFNRFCRIVEKITRQPLVEDGIVYSGLICEYRLGQTYDFAFPESSEILDLY